MKNKFLNFTVGFLKSRNVTFYIAFAFAVISFVFGIVATACLGVAGGSAAAVGLTLAGFVLFIVFSLLGHERIGAAAVAIASFVSVIAIVVECYSYMIVEVQAMAMTGFSISGVLAIDGVTAALACMIGLLLCAIAENIFAYLRLRKKDKQTNIQSTEEAK